MSFLGPKPRALLDISIKGSRFNSALAKRINLGQPRAVIVIPLKALFYPILIWGIGFYLFFGSALAPTHYNRLLAAQDGSQNEEQRKILETQLAEIEEQMAQYEKTIIDYQKQGKTLNNEIKNLNNKIAKLNLQMKATMLSIKKMDEEIADNQNRVMAIESKLNFNKKALRDSLRDIYEKQNINLVGMILKNPRLSDFFGDINNLMSIQYSLSQVVAEVVGLRDELLEEKEQLSIKRSDASATKAYNDLQKKSLQDIKSGKDKLLKTTKGKESKYQEILKETRKSAAQIRSQIFQLLGGGELTFEEAYKFAKLAEQATGVRAALILAVLDRESALGQNVGRCNYKTAAHPTRDLPIFLKIVEELNINPDSIMVSCPNRDGLYGGAMGPAQFIASTWAIYKNRVAEITGNNPPSPWRNADAFIATALYLKDALGACGNYSGLAKERCAAARYYAGGRWSRYLWTYGDRVVNRAEQFQGDIDILNS